MFNKIDAKLSVADVERFEHIVASRTVHGTIRRVTVVKLLALVDLRDGRNRYTVRRGSEVIHSGQDLAVAVRWYNEA